jgi:maltose alpha-D-glucosyltransferase/alpha-amylase
MISTIHFIPFLVYLLQGVLLMTQWLHNAVFYEIYPQSFYDSNGDGVGDLAGITQKLDYIQGLGCNGIWVNPCFDSPFKDAGYDVRDYKRIAPRYGTNEDARLLFDAAHQRGLRVIFDLVPGHSSEEHSWFIESQKAAPNAFSNRYIWTSHVFERPDSYGFIGGESERNATYLLNFFKCQPALNYGFLNPSKPWQLPIDHPDCLATREAIKDVMRFWLERGCDGFRVDMAGSLVKNDDAEHSGTKKVWEDIRAMLDEDYPDALLIAEWSEPKYAIGSGFDMDFMLDFANEGKIGSKTLFRDYSLPLSAESSDNSFFRAEGDGDIKRFLDVYLPHYEATKGSGFISLITGNHDVVRAAHNLSQEELKIAYAVILTLPGVPFIYYGDEIGMRYLTLPNKEGGYDRTGSRTPMQWHSGFNRGFSTAPTDSLYLPFDPRPDAPTVEDQEDDEESLLATVKKFIELRHNTPALCDNTNLEVLKGEGHSFVYRRDELVIAANPGKAVQKVKMPYNRTYEKRSILEIVSLGGPCTWDGGELRLGAKSFAVWSIS